MKSLEERFWAKVDKRGPDECVNRSKSGITCGEPAVTYLDGQALCALHAMQIKAQPKKVKRK